MKRVFKVTLHLKDHSKDVFNTLAKDDLEARSKTESELKKAWDEVDGKFPGVDYAEVELVCEVDAG